MISISIIVPVYNAGNFLAPCIESVLKQTFEDFELLLIDDGSTDGSGKVCDEYAAKDNRLRVVHKANEGINATRRRGVHEAKGEWIAFSDDDDTMTTDALESLYALHEGTDIVCGFDLVPQKRLAADASIDDIRHAFLAGQLSVTPWAKLYRRSLLTDDMFDFPREIDGEEDMIMNTRLFFKTTVPPRILYKHVYNFRRNTASVSHTKRASVEHEEAFYKALYTSIPESIRQQFLPQITFLKLNGLFPIAFSQPESLVDKHQSYLKQIFDDAKACGYKMSLKEWMLMHATSKLILKLTGFAELVRRSVKYRLGKA